MFKGIQRACAWTWRAKTGELKKGKNAERSKRDAQTIMPRLHLSRLRAGALNTPRAEGSKHIMRPSERACALGKP